MGFFRKCSKFRRSIPLKLCLSEKALIEVGCNLETVGNGGKSALVNTKQAVILYDFANTKQAAILYDFVNSKEAANLYDFVNSKEASDLYDFVNS